MKKIFIILLCSALSSFAITPFSLENLKSVNFKILDKKKILKSEVKEALKSQIQEKLLAAHLQTQSDNFANFLISFKIYKLENKELCTVSLLLIEDVSIQRASKTKAIAITYKKEDSFEVENFQEDLSESIEYLIDDFLAQYEEEN
jgi:hypothetical protein